jgi:hypothetical protein
MALDATNFCNVIRNNHIIPVLPQSQKESIVKNIGLLLTNRK